MKKLRVSWAISLIVLACSLPIMLGPGCMSNNREEAIDTLFGFGQKTDAAYQLYLGLVASGAIPTNSVPEITQYYQLFQSNFTFVAASSALNSNVPSAINLSNAQSQLLLAIEAQKPKK
jgi:hypothetical protein